MNNKFKIRELEKNKRTLDKQIEKLKLEDEMLHESELIYSLTENVFHKLNNIVINEEETMHLYENNLELRRYKDTCIFIIKNKKLDIFVAGYSNKHKDDEFDFDKGFKIAEYRARILFTEELLKQTLKDKR